MDGAAGRVEDGARSRRRVRREDAPAVVCLARVLPRLLRRAREPAQAIFRPQPRSPCAPRVHGLARLLRPGGDLPQRPARLPRSRVPPRTRAVGRVRPPRPAARVGLAYLGAGGRGGLPPRVSGRAQPRSAARRDRRRARGRRRREQDPRRRGAVQKHAAARRSRAVRAEGQRGTGARAHPDEPALRGRDRARRHVRPGVLPRVRAGGRDLSVEREVGLASGGARDLHRVRPARGARARPRRAAVRRSQARSTARIRVGRVSIHGLHAQREHERRDHARVPSLRVLAGHVRLGARCVGGARRLDEVRSAARRAAVGDVPGRSSSGARFASRRRSSPRPLSPSRSCSSSRRSGRPLARSGSARSGSSPGATRRSRSGAGGSTTRAGFPTSAFCSP